MSLMSQPVGKMDEYEGICILRLIEFFVLRKKSRISRFSESMGKHASNSLSKEKGTENSSILRVIRVILCRLVGEFTQDTPKRIFSKRSRR